MPDEPRPEPITPPADFPVEWDEPSDARRAWMQEVWHTPAPVTPLSFDVNDRTLYEGFRQGGAAKGFPTRTAITRINTYLYRGERRPLPDDPVPADDVPEGAANLAMWDETWLPEIQQHLRHFERFDLGAADDVEIAAHIEDTLDRTARFWTIHSMVEVGQLGFSAFAGELLGVDELTAATMLQGFPNKSLEAGDGVRRLAVSARAVEGAAAIVRSTEAAELLTALRGLPAAAGLLDEIDTFLAEFGRKSDNFTEMADVTWVENPTPLFALLKLYLDDETDFDTRRAELVDARERAIEAARQQLAGDDANLDRFNERLEIAQRTSMLMENHNYWIDQQSMYWVRQALVEGGRRLQQRGAITDVEDVMYVELAELLDRLRSDDTTDLGGRIAERRAEMERWAPVDAPAFLGVDVPRRPGVRLMFGLDSDVESRDDDETAAIVEVTGQAGSPGTHTGRARVIESIADGERLQSGDVMVTMTTSPPWTPLFGVAGALVTDAGGVLSHCAIVAREYGIPAVVGSGNGTQAIADGALVEVDGTAGVVRILEAAGE